MALPMSGEAKALLRRANKARDFPNNTCPASRHVMLLAWGLLRGVPIEPEEAEHCAESMLATVASLWEARKDAARFEFLQNLPPKQAQAFFWNYTSRRARVRAIDAAMAVKEEGVDA